MASRLVRSPPSIKFLPLESSPFWVIQHVSHVLRGCRGRPFFIVKQLEAPTMK